MIFILIYRKILKVDHDWVFMEKYSSYVSLLGFGSLFSIVTFLIVYSFYSLNGNIATNILLTGFTAAMGLAIFQQVKKEANYLENFQPQVRLVRIYGSKIKKRQIEGGNKLDFPVLAINTSQTSGVIEEARIMDHKDLAIRLRGGPDKDNNREYDGSVPVKANESMNLYLETQDSLSEDKAESLKNEDFINLAVRGENLETEDVNIPIVD